MRKIIRRLVSQVGLLAVILAACSPVEDETSQSFDALSSGQSSSVGLVADLVPGDIDEVKAQLLENQNDRPIEERFLHEFERQTQDEIAACMAGEGFEYISWIEPAQEPRFDIGDTFPDGFSPVDALLQVHGVAAVSVGAVNPNETILAGMSPDEREAYLDTLWKPGGCGESAYRRVEDRMAEVLGEPLEDLENAINEIPALVAGDERVVDAQNQFARCMKTNTGLEGLRNENDIAFHFEQILLPAIEAEADAKRFDEPTPDGMSFDASVEIARADESFVMRSYFECVSDLMAARSTVRAEVVDRRLNGYSDALKRLQSDG